MPVSVRRVRRGLHEVVATGGHYSITRRIAVEPTRVLVTDTLRNTGGDDLGVIIDNHLAGPAPFDTTHVAGYPQATERREAKSPSTFVTYGELGVGIVPLDDVTIVHSTVYAKDGRAGVRDDKFGLAAGAEYTGSWGPGRPWPRFDVCLCKLFWVHSRCLLHCLGYSHLLSRASQVFGQRISLRLSVCL